LSAFSFFSSNADITKPKIYYIFKKKPYKHNNNNNEKLRRIVWGWMDRYRTALGPDWFGAGTIA
jgi:hypothetical protein